MKKIFKLLTEYITVVGIGALLLAILWLFTVPPYPYRAFIGCAILGLIVGYALGFNTKKQ